MMTKANMGFDQFIGIDWSGAKGKRHKGLAVAVADRAGRVEIITANEGGPERAGPKGSLFWSRKGVLDFLEGQARRSTRTLVAIDASFSAPFVDQGCFLPGHDLGKSAADFWEAVEKHGGGDDDLSGRGFVDAYDAFFRRMKEPGRRFERRYRRCESLCREEGYPTAETLFHLIGPSQVGLSSLSIMRLLVRLKRRPDVATSNVAIWPFDDHQGANLVLVEAFATQCLGLAGIRGKVHDTDQLMALLADLDGRMSPDAVSRFDALRERDHMADAIAMALGARRMADMPQAWAPPAMDDTIRQSEGWTFGVGCGLKAP